jgi:SAM-dependent methyltransferase
MDAKAPRVNDPDIQFALPRLAEIYDVLDGDRSDLDPYRALVDELHASKILDLGCGTGTFACLLALHGKEVVAVDPAAASVEVGRHKPGSDRVRWIIGDATVLPPLQVDVVTMTANVAQVFLTEADWMATLHGAHAALRPGGRLLFETRNPAKEAWRSWTRQNSCLQVEIPGIGHVEFWREVTDIRVPFISFRSTYVFGSDGAILTSDSTLRFREETQITESLHACGFTVESVQDAPDRPGLELVFVAARTAN